MLGGIFSSQANLTDAFEADRSSDITQQDIHVSFPFTNQQTKEAFIHALIKVIRGGNILVRRHDASNPLPVIEIIDDHDPEFDLNLSMEVLSRSRNIDLQSKRMAGETGKR